MSEARQLVVLPVAVLVPPVAPAAALAEVVEQAADPGPAEVAAYPVAEQVAAEFAASKTILAVATKTLAVSI